MSTPFNAFTLVELLAFAGLSFLYVRADDSLSARVKTEYTVVAGILFAIGSWRPGSIEDDEYGV